MRQQTGIIKLIFSGAIWLALTSIPALAQDAIQVTDQNWNFDFRDNVTFTLSAESSAEIIEADLFYRVVGQLATSRNDAEFTPGQAITAEFIIDQTEPGNYFPPGTDLEYWWKLVDANGNELKTERETITYTDDRVDWQSLEDERLTIYWYEGDEEFGQALFERANVALDTLETDIGIALENPIKIFIYANHNDLLSALSITAQEWTGGVAYTEYGVVIIGIHPRQLDWGLNAMTHEMTHLVIHQATDNPFSGLPNWLDEGIAVYNENRNQLDDDFKPLFDRAVANNELMTLRTLTSPFPGDPLLANLAYGQSGATVKFIVDTYGSDKMGELLSIFAEGAVYDEALMEALGVDTDGLDNAFRASLGLPPLPGTETAESEDSQAESAAVEETTSEDQEVAQAPQATEEAVAAVESAPTSAVNDSSASSEPENASQGSVETSAGPLGFLPCVGGMLMLLVAGGVIFRRA
jgi:hypothetical protein